MMSKINIFNLNYKYINFNPQITKCVFFSSVMEKSEDCHMLKLIKSFKKCMKAKNIL